MGLSPQDILTISQTNAAFRFQPVTIWHATTIPCPTCAYDKASHAAVFLDCATCHGYGKVISYAQEPHFVRVGQVNADWHYTGIGETESGAITLQVGAGEHVSFRKARDTEESFVQVYNFNVKPLAMWPSILGDEWVLRCEAVNIERWMQSRAED